MDNRIPVDVPPGDYILEELEARGWTQRDLAGILDRPPSVINQIIKGRTGITPETAFDLAEAFGTSPQLWLNLETSYRLAKAEAPTGVRERAQLYELAPISEMQKRGWIKKAKRPAEIESELCRFFGVDSIEDIKAVSACARASADDGGELTPEQSAWCQRARHMAQSVRAARHTKAAFERGLYDLRSLMAHAEGVREVPRVLSEMGVRFVVVEHLARTKIDGAALWLDSGKPVVAVSMRYGRIDYFWFTLGHELDHIRRKDRRAIDEDILSGGVIGEVEQRANRASAAMAIDQDMLQRFIDRKRPYFSKTQIIQFAHRAQVHPGIVAGQLQFRKEIKYTANREMLSDVRQMIVEAALTDGWGTVVPT